MATRFEPASDFENELQTMVSPALRAVADDLARTIAELTPARTGKAASKVEATVGDDNRPRVRTTDPAGHLIEWGSQHNTAYAPFRRGVAQAGLRFKEE